MTQTDFDRPAPLSSDELRDRIDDWHNNATSAQTQSPPLTTSDEISGWRKYIQDIASACGIHPDQYFAVGLLFIHDARLLAEVMDECSRLSKLEGDLTWKNYGWEWTDFLVYLAGCIARNTVGNAAGNADLPSEVLGDASRPRAPGGKEGPRGPEGPREGSEEGDAGLGVPGEPEGLAGAIPALAGGLGGAAVVAGPLTAGIQAVGFGSGGVVAGSIAATIQSVVYGGATGGVFSVLQSIGAVGFGPVGFIVGTAIGAAVASSMRRRGNSGNEPDRTSSEPVSPEPPLSREKNDA